MTSAPSYHTTEMPQCEICGAGADEADLGWFRVTEYHYRTACWNGFACRRRTQDRDADMERQYAEHAAKAVPA